MSSSSDQIFPPGRSGHQARPLLIAGPCSAESEEQVMETARGIESLEGIDLFRCGIWKPRTRPGEFEGVGRKGLDWLKRVREETGLRAMVEVALPAHVEMCLEAGIEVMWIGSRTIVSPFSVEEIASALEGNSTTVFVKNPVSPDLGLWLGALERLDHHGLRKLAAIHRGFTVPEPGPYRNSPLWHLPLELKKQLPGLPLVGDPSHICGSTDLLAYVSQYALDLGYDGLMIETHIHPETALTDRGQQLTPAELGSLLQNLDFSPPSPELKQMQALREAIDRLDDRLIEALAGRMKVSERIGALKKELGLDVADQERWNEVVKDRLIKAGLSGLDLEFVRTILEEIHQESIRKQRP